MSRNTDQLIAALAAIGGSGDVEALARALSDQLGFTVSSDRARRLLSDAGEDIIVDGDQVRLVHRVTAAPDEPPEDEKAGPRRAVAIDFETVPVESAEGIERIPWQVGAVRFGTDFDWVAQAPTFEALLTLDDATFDLFADHPAADRVTRHGRAPDQVATELNRWLADADTLVAYNGAEVDFPVLDRLCGTDATDHRTTVDGLYYGYALWPARHAPPSDPDAPSGHHLAAIAARAGLSVEENATHDALYDAELLAGVVQAAADRMARLDPPTLLAISAIGRTSPSWQLLADLAGLELRPLDRADARPTITAALNLPRLRPERGQTRTPATIAVPDHLRRSGRIDPGLLAVAAVDGVKEAEVRPPQQQMTEYLRTVIANRTGGLCEAATGTGKSEAMLAVALEWLEASPANQVIIATYTKQLQSDLAARIQRLDGIIGGLRDASDLVKGASNRLSLRGLVTAAVALAVDDSRGSLAAALRDNPSFRDLMAWLLLRLQLTDPSVAQPAMLDEWDARSVDRTDVPAVFDVWADGHLDMWLNDVSQARASDYPHRDDHDQLSAATRRVGEAVRASRLVIANHALLLNVIDQIDDLGDRALLLVDEAHRVEDAATSAFTISVPYGPLARLARELAGWTAATVPDSPVQETAEALAGFLDSEVVVRPAARLLGIVRPDEVSQPGQHLRRATVATGLGVDEASAADAETLLWAHLRLRSRVAACYATLADMAPPSDPSDADTYWSLRARVGDTVTQLTALVAHLAELLDIDLNGPAAQQADAGSSEDTDGTAVQLTLEDVDVDNRDSDRRHGDGVAANRVVWLKQHVSPGFTGTNWTAFRYELASTPVRIGDEPDWQRLLHAPAAIALVSATLTVPPSVDGDDQWRFLSYRLGLPPGWAEPLQVHAPFDYRRQARLVTLADFPSWAEQSNGAVLTMVHQLHRYLNEVAPDRHGAMVLTTSTAVAREVADKLRRRRAAGQHRWPVHPATLYGNQPAVEAFKNHGGVLVGTKGLWQGINVDEPDRCRLVWINKLPFPSFGDPIIAARRAYEAETARIEGHRDPDHVATGRYYLPLAAIELKQGVGRLIRSDRHRGVIVISDRKLAGRTRLRRLYRQVFLGALEDGLATPATDPGADQTTTMVDAWRTIWAFLAERDPEYPDVEPVISPATARRLTQPDALESHVWLPETLAIRRLAMDDDDVSRHRDAETLPAELARRVAEVGGNKDLSGTPHELRDKQVEVLNAIADGRDVLGVLPTGYGKSLLYQGPGLVLPGVTLVVSPLVSLMQDQAIDLNRTVGGAVRALVAPMRESNSRMGKAEVTQQLLGDTDHGIRLVYLSPERLGHAQFQQMVAASVERGIVRRIAIDEAHTWAAWGDDFRPSFRRAETFLDRLKADHPDLQIIAVTATATASVREHLTATVFARSVEAGTFSHVTGNPVRPELAVYRRRISGQRGRRQRKVTALVEQVATNLTGHAIFYATTIDQVEQTHTHLNTLAGRHRLQVLKYHGQMDDVAKNAAIQAFHEAPTDPSDPDFRPTVVVATTAFGLGINRGDIRHVFVISPPTDLAGLYQMLGRAGRDMRRRDGGDWPVPTTAMAAITGRNVRILRFMLQQRIYDRDDVIIAAAKRLLRRPGGGTAVANLRNIGDDLRAADVRAGKLGEDEADDSYVVSGYRTLAGRVYAALSGLGALDDLGDIPRRAAIDPVDLRPDDADPDQLSLAETVLTTATELRADGRGVDLAPLWDRLPDDVRDEFGDLGTMWAELLNLHAFGLLDVSQAPNIGHGYVSAYQPQTTAVPDGLPDRVAGHHAARQDDLARLIGWFNDDRTCCNASVAAYFTGDDQVPEHTCADAQWACSDCLAYRHPPGQTPVIHRAFFTREADLVPIAQRQSERADRNLDRQVVALLGAATRGLTTSHLRALLAGDSHYWVVSRNEPRKVLRSLADHAAAGKQPGLSDQRLQVALSRLADTGQIVRDTYVWWHPDRKQDADQRAQQAAQA